MGRPLLVYSPSVCVVSQLVMAFATLCEGLAPYGGKVIPFLPVSSPLVTDLLIKRKGKKKIDSTSGADDPDSPTLSDLYGVDITKTMIGVTNPFFLKFSHLWPNILKIESDGSVAFTCNRSQKHFISPDSSIMSILHKCINVRNVYKSMFPVFAFQELHEEKDEFLGVYPLIEGSSSKKSKISAPDDMTSSVLVSLTASTFQSNPTHALSIPFPSPCGIEIVSSQSTMDACLGEISGTPHVLSQEEEEEDPIVMHDARETRSRSEVLHKSPQALPQRSYKSSSYSFSPKSPPFLPPPPPAHLCSCVFISHVRAIMDEILAPFNILFRPQLRIGGGNVQELFMQRALSPSFRRKNLDKRQRKEEDLRKKIQRKQEKLIFKEKKKLEKLAKKEKKKQEKIETSDSLPGSGESIPPLESAFKPSSKSISADMTSISSSISSSTVSTQMSSPLSSQTSPVSFTPSSSASSSSILGSFSPLSLRIYPQALLPFISQYALGRVTLGGQILPSSSSSSYPPPSLTPILRFSSPAKRVAFFNEFVLSENISYLLQIRPKIVSTSLEALRREARVNFDIKSGILAMEASGERDLITGLYCSVLQIRAKARREHDSVLIQAMNNHLVVIKEHMTEKERALLLPLDSMI
ncbi:hypothetical protein ADUPG1_011252 [Aduncisulcus paluster]|uniref:cDENN domain-containing protein n=1 Tax=Aduncisulcus paluster TaxID=2918883 RepID=A0ABQ5JV02_9EUKA|nr:hypothetical protein ADUPG1_011252 [Aduncisulcus paluster]